MELFSCYRTKGIKHDKQITWDNKHPTYGAVFTIDWNSLRDAIQKRMKGNVFSLKVTNAGIVVYTRDGDCSMNGAAEFWRWFSN